MKGIINPITYRGGLKLLSVTFSAALLLSGCSGGAAVSGAVNAAGARLFGKTDGLISQGTIEVKEVDINTKLPGKVSRVLVEEGDEVKAGDVIIELESDELKAKETQAKAQLEAAKAGLEASEKEAGAAKAAAKAAAGQTAAARAQLQKAENGAREQEIAEAQAYYDLMLKTSERVGKLFEKGAVSAQKKDEVDTQLKLAEEQLSMANEGARSEDKLSASALVAQASAVEQAAGQKAQQAEAGVDAAGDKVDMAQGAVDEVEAYLNNASIKAPIDGIITALDTEAGELVSTGMAIGTVSVVTEPWIEVKVRETDLGSIALNQEVEIKTTVNSSKTYTGKVVKINQKPDFATKRASNDNGDYDVISYGVKITVSDPESELRPGMTAFVYFKKG